MWSYIVCFSLLIFFFYRASYKCIWIIIGRFLLCFRAQYWKQCGFLYRDTFSCLTSLRIFWQFCHRWWGFVIFLLVQITTNSTISIVFCGLSCLHPYQCQLQKRQAYLYLIVVWKFYWDSNRSYSVFDHLPKILCQRGSEMCLKNSRWISNQ